MSSPSLISAANHGICPWWLAYTFDNPLRRLFHKPQVILGDYVTPGMTVMDLGCGMGYFSVGMAEMVGDTGTVLAVDLQQKMLATVMKRARRAGLAGRIVPCLGRADNIATGRPLDFILAFWMVHEVPAQQRLFQGLKQLLAPAGKILIAEPKMHVSAAGLNKSLDTAQSCGLRCIARPGIRFSRTALLEPAPAA